MLLSFNSGFTLKKKKHYFFSTKIINSLKICSIGIQYARRKIKKSITSMMKRITSQAFTKHFSEDYKIFLGQLSASDARGNFKGLRILIWSSLIQRMPEGNRVGNSLSLFIRVYPSPIRNFIKGVYWFFRLLLMRYQ